MEETIFDRMTEKIGSMARGGEGALEVEMAFKDVSSENYL